MKKVKIICLILIAALALTACGGPTWQEKYDLGMRYLDEGNYEEAIIAFNAAIKIDPKRADSYISLADTYVAMGDYDNAKKVLLEVPTEITDYDVIREKILEVSKPQPKSGYPKTKKFTNSDGSYKIAEYNQYGLLIHSFYYKTNGEIMEQYYEYDDYGKKVKEIIQEQYYKSEMYYDEQERLIKEYEYSNHPEFWESITEIKYTYHPNSNVAEADVVKDIIEDYGYGNDDTGRHYECTFSYEMENDKNYIDIAGLRWKVEWNPSLMCVMHVYEYSVKNSVEIMVKEVNYDEYGNVVETFKYDEQGNIVEKYELDMEAD